MKKALKWLTPAVMAVLFLVMYLVEYRHVIIFHEQHHLFRFSADHIAWTVHEYGLWQMLTEFVAQFAYWPWLGAAVWTALLMATYFMARSAIWRLTGLRDRLQLSAILPVVQFFSTINVDQFPTLALEIFTWTLLAWVVALIFGRFIPKRWASDDASKLARTMNWVGPLIFLAIFALGYQNFYKARSVTLPSGKVREMTSEDVHQQRRIERIMMAADQAMRRKDWDTVLELADEQAATGRPNHLIDYFRTMALYHKGQLLERLFDHPQKFGQRALFYPWKPDRNQAEYGGYVYEQLGALNSAIHWEFEALVGWGETSHHLINLSRYYIKAGKPEQARKFMAPLRSTLFYRGAYNRLEEQLKAGDVEEIHNAAPEQTDSLPRWDNVVDLAEDLAFLYRNDPENKMVQEYLLASMLLKNRYADFYRMLKMFWPAGKPLPKMIQQALCLVRIQYGSEQLKADGFEISPEVDADFRDYLSRHSKGQAARYTLTQKQTPWYYVHYISPEGHQLIFD